MRGHTWGTSLLGRDVRGLFNKPTRPSLHTRRLQPGQGGPHEARPPGQVPPSSTGPVPVTLQAVGTWVLPAMAPGAVSIPLCGADLFLLFLTTETLTCNDAIFLQGLLPADLERRVQNLRETQVAHSSWFWK